MSLNSIIQNETESKQLTKTESRNLTLLVFAFACLMSATTLIVGTSQVVVISIGNEIDKDYTDLAPISLAAFILGTAIISLITTSHIFKHGRQVGFLVGNVFGILGAMLGALSIWTQSISLLIISYIPLGAANGIGNYVRFAAVEVVPPVAHFQALAVTLVLSGGVISAFVGPETAQRTKYLFGEEYVYLGAFLMIGIFNLIMAFLVSLTEFPQQDVKQIAVEEEDCNETKTTMSAKTSGPNMSQNEQDQRKSQIFRSLFLSRQFWVPCLLSTLCWGCMFMPMSIVRVAMGDLGYSPRQSLNVIEMHFLGMFSPGFLSGNMIKTKGTMFTNIFAVVLFLCGILSNITMTHSLEEGGTIFPWALGLFLLGAGWHFGFSASTMLLTEVYVNHPEMKSKIQSTNDFFMFGLSGIMVISTGYIYDPKGGRTECDHLCGWKVVNHVTCLYTVMLICILLFEGWCQWKDGARDGALKVKNNASEDILDRTEIGEYGSLLSATRDIEKEQ